MNSPMMRRPLECFAFQVKTEQGDAMGIGGICHASTAQYWMEQLRALQKLHVRRSGIVQVDLDLAEAMAALSDETLVVAGITLFAKGLELPDGVRTGGVIGCPNGAIQSADSTGEELPEGFSQCAVPGGPGLAAQAPKETVERALRHIRADCAADLPVDEVMGALRSFGIRTGLLVYDGTGRQAPGYLLAFTEDQFHHVLLKEKSCM